MKFTSTDLMKAMKLQVGDKVRIADDIYKLYLTDLGNYYLNCIKYSEKTKMYSTKDIELIDLLDKDYEILPRPKRVGDLKCGEYGKQNCSSCPIRAICVSDEYNNDTLYEKLELSHKYAKDQEIYDLLKARLDKEVE